MKKQQRRGGVRAVQRELDAFEKKNPKARGLKELEGDILSGRYAERQERLRRMKERRKTWHTE